jgi:peptide/nickel transport system substrate-binding protein
MRKLGEKTKKTLSLLLILISTLTFLSGCINQKGETPVTEAPPKEHILTYTFFETMANWDPAITFDSTIAVVGETYETLVFYDGEADPVFQPKLAERWEQSEDKLSWTFYLRKGVKFHTGREMTANDVKYSIDRTVEMGKGAAYIWIGLEKIEVVDPYTVRFISKFPMAIPLILSASYGSYILDSEEVKSKGTYDQQTTWFQQGKECGTGPYYVDSWEQTQQVVFKKFNDYWGGWEGNHFDTAIMKYVEEGSTIVQMVEGGDAQLITEPPTDMIPRLQRNDKLVVKDFDTFINDVVTLNVKKPPTDELAVRQALSYAFDYETVCKDIWGGYAIPSRGPVPEGIWGKPDDLFQYKFDLEKAKQLLDGAGWKDTNGDGIREKNGKKLSVVFIAQDPPEGYRKAAELWQSDLKQIGFEVELNIIPFDTGWTRSRNFDTSSNGWFLGWWPTLITPFDMLYSMFHSSQIGVFNTSYYNNPKFDEIIMKGNELEGSDMKKAAEYYGIAQKMLIEEAIGVYTWDKKSIFVYSKEISGVKPNPAYPNTLFIYNVYWKE